MSDTIKFLICASTNKVGSKAEREVQVDREDLEGIPEEEWEDYVWEELGGKETFWEIVHSSCVRVVE